MTKRQLVKWLEKKQNEALSNAEKLYEDTLNKYLTERDKKMSIKAVAEAIADLIARADVIAETWCDEIKENVPGVSICCGYRSLRHQISDVLTPYNVELSLRNHFVDNSTAKVTLDDKKININSEIKKNYVNVIANVQAIKNVKAAVAYLQRLGFDLTELIELDRNPVQTALFVEIDRKFLFVDR